MLSLSDILLPEDILLDLDVTSPATLFDAIGQNMQRWHGLPRVSVAEVLGLRETLGCTALGQGVAIPHGRLAGLRQTHAAYARPRRPLPFSAPDGKPVTDFIVLLVPERATEEHLGILAGVSSLFTDPRFREALHACTDPHEIRALFRAWQAAAA